MPLREVVSLAEESARRGHGLVSLPTGDGQGGDPGHDDPA
jgi:hypothetical protein